MSLGGGHTPTEQKDSVISKSTLHLLEAICEGEIEGWATGAAETSIFLNRTPLVGIGGVENFKNVVARIRTGSQTQEPIWALGATYSQDSVNLEVKHSAPAVHSFTDDHVRELRVVIRFPALYKQEDDGDIVGASVDLAIDVAFNGFPPQRFLTEKVAEMSKGGFTKQFVVNLPAPTAGAGVNSVYIHRLSEDDGSLKSRSAFVFASLIKVIPGRLNYPNTALVYLKLDAEQFQQVPERRYWLRLLRIKVPSNYDPDPYVRSYTGDWDGNFKIAWSNNPAWVFFDLVTHPRYGVGKRVSPDMVSGLKWALYRIGQYCDELIDSGWRNPDGSPIMKPRYVCNVFFQSRDDAFALLQNLASVFHGILFYGPSRLDIAQDALGEIAWLFTPANVVGGSFIYSSSSLRNRATVVLVAWNDQEDFFKRKILAVQDRKGIAKYGYREKQVTAVGCVSRHQAVRYGRYLLASEAMEGQSVRFRTGVEACALKPGQLIHIADPLRDEGRLGGRLLAVASDLRSVRLDYPVERLPDRTYTLMIISPSGAASEHFPAGDVMRRAVSSAPGKSDALSLALPLPAKPVDLAVWILSCDQVAPVAWRILSVTPSQDNELEIEISAVLHAPSKQAIIDNFKLDPVPTPDIPLRAERVTEFWVHINLLPPELVLSAGDRSASSGRDAAVVTIGWKPAKSAAMYSVVWHRKGAAPSAPIMVDATEFEIPVLAVRGEEYALSVCSVGISGAQAVAAMSPWYKV